MSTTPQGPGWWQASDGNWYPPELAPGASPAPEPSSPPAASASEPPSSPSSPVTSSSPSTRQPSGSQFAMGGGGTRRPPDAAEITVLAGAGVVLLASFLAFYEVSAGPFSDSRNAWGTGLFPLATLIVLFAVAAGVLVLVRVLGAEVPDRVVSFSRAQLVLVCGGFAALQSLAFLVVDHAGADFGIGFWLMLLGSLAVLVGAVLLFRADTTSRR
jgi:hypothetical protein